MNTDKSQHFNIFFTIAVLVLLGLVVLGGVQLVKSNRQTMPALSNRDVALSCTTDMATKFHIHPHLSIVIDGKDEIIPGGVGITGVCMNPLHTHDATGKLHIESPVQRDFTLGDFFAVWKKEFNQSQILDKKVIDGSSLAVTVNGEKVDTYENTVLHENDVIVITYTSK